MESSSNSPSPERLLEHVAWLRRLAGTLVLDAARADDVTQQTLLEALQRAPARVDHPRAWLATVARNFARSWSRGDTRRQSLERATARPEAEPATDEVVARTAQHHQVVGAVLALAEPYRTAVLLRFFENLKPGAIAKRTGVPVETVRTRLRRGLELLRAELVQRKGNGAFALVGLIDSGMRAAAMKLVLGGSVAGGVVGGVVMSVKGKVVIAAVVVACAVVAVVELRDSSINQQRNVVAGSKSSEGSPTETAGESKVAVARDVEPNPQQRARSIRARVVDEAGAPVAGARVGVAAPIAPTRDDFDAAKTPFSFVAGSVATTSETGECSLALAEGDGRCIVDVAALADGFNPGWWPRARAGDEILLTLFRAGELTGVVRDIAGTPVAGAIVRAVVDGPRRFDVSTTSQTDGSYRLAGFPGTVVRFDHGEHTPSWITISASGFASEHFWSLDNVRDEGRGVFRLDPWLVRGAVVRGRVVDAFTGTAIEGADVWIHWWDARVGPIELKTKSGADGSFTIERVPSWGVQLVGMYSPNLNRRDLGELRAMAAGRGCDSCSLEVPDDGAEISCVLHLAPVGSVRGRVVDGSGRPLEGAWVGAAGRAAIGVDWRGELEGRPFVRTLTDVNGVYELRDLALADGLETRVPINARFESEAFASSEMKNLSVVLEAGRTVAAPDLVLAPIPGLLVHVVDEAGRDVSGAVVDKWKRTSTGRGQYDGRIGNKTGATGRCFLAAKSSEAGTSRATFVTVDAVGFGPAEQDLTSETGAIRIALAPEHHLHGWIRDEAGRPGGAGVVVVPALEAPEDLADALRTGEYWKHPRSFASRDEVVIGEGRFLVRGLGPGPWHVAAERLFHDGTHSVVVVPDVTDEQADVEIVVPRSAEKNPTFESSPSNGVGGVGSVELTLTSAESGKPIFRAGYTFLHAAGKDHWPVAIAPGRFRYTDVPAGTAELRLDVPGTAHESRSLVVEAGRTTSLAVALSTGLVARGRIVLADLPEFRKGTVQLDSTDGGGSVSAILADDGSFRVPGLVTGSHYRLWLVLEKPDGETSTFITEEPRRPASEWTVDSAPRLVPAAWFTVRSRDNGSPFPDRTTLRLIDSEGRDAYTLTFRGNANNWGQVIAAGDYTVRLEIPGQPVQEQKATISSTGVNYFDFEVR